ncbi:hypothetical protein Tco_0316159 [Tanacetum coccineum]
MDYNNRHLVEMLQSLYEFNGENIQLDHATLVDQFVASNLSKFGTKERGIMLIEHLRSRFLRSGEGLGVEQLWGEDGEIQIRKRIRESDGYLLEKRKKQNLDTRSDSFGSSDSWISKSFGGNNGGGGGILNQEGNNGGDNDVNMGGGDNDVNMNGGDNDVNMGGGGDNDQDLGDHNGDGGAQNVAVPGGGENVAVPDGGLVVPHHVADDVPLGGDGGGLVPGGDPVVPRVVDDDRPVILALPAPDHHVLPVVLGLPARDAGGVMHPGDIGGGGGEIPIAHAAHAYYFPGMVVVAVSVASLLAYRFLHGF